MSTLQFQTLCNTIADEVGALLPGILSSPDDANISNGNCALVIMNSQGDTVMRLYGGANKPRQRESALVAAKKAFQVWLTACPTGTYEKLVYTGQVDESLSGIPRPEYIGWLGGVEATQANGERLILAFSGVRGEQDVGILKIAAQRLGTFTIND